MPAEWIRSAAEALAAALSRGTLPRLARPAARRTLARAFDAVEAQTGDAALLRRLEAPLAPAPLELPPPPVLLAVQARLRPPAQRDDWRAGVRIRGACSAALVERMVGHGALAARIEARIEAVLATFRTRPPAQAQRPRAHRLAEASDMDDHALTRG